MAKSWAGSSAGRAPGSQSGGQGFDPPSVHCMHRFYCPHADFSSKEIAITDKDELHHLSHVLRLGEGVRVVVFNAKAQEAAGRILTSTPKKTVIAIETVRQSSFKTPAIILACAIPKRGKFECIVEKVTELGADEIIPLKTCRTEVHWDNHQMKQKISRYQTVAVNAAKQSGRTSVPVISPVIDFDSALEGFDAKTVVFMPSLTGERKNLLEAFEACHSPEKIAFLIGPEGDFTPQEYARAHQGCCVPVSLGDNVLKVETAAVAAVACANFYYRHASIPIT